MSYASTWWRTASSEVRPFLLNTSSGTSPCLRARSSIRLPKTSLLWKLKLASMRSIARSFVISATPAIFSRQLELFGDTFGEERTLTTTWPQNWTHALNDKNREYLQENWAQIKRDYGKRKVKLEHNPVVILVKEGMMIEKPWQYTRFRKTLPHWHVSELIWHKLAYTISRIMTEKRHQDNYLKITPDQTQRGNHTWVRCIQPIWNAYTTYLCAYWKYTNLTAGCLTVNSRLFALV